MWACLDKKPVAESIETSGLPQLPKVNELQVPIAMPTGSIDFQYGQRGIMQCGQHSDSSTLSYNQPQNIPHREHSRSDQKREQRVNTSLCRDSRTLRASRPNLYSDSTDEETEKSFRKLTRKHQTKHNLKDSTKKAEKSLRLKKDDIYYSDSSDEDFKEAVENLPTKSRVEEKKEEQYDFDYVTWSISETQGGLKNNQLYNWLDEQTNTLKEIKEQWTVWMDKIKNIQIAGREGEFKALEVERNQQMCTALGGIHTFILLMKDTLDIEGAEAPMEEADCGFNHTIRSHRFSRADFVRQKSNIEGKIKDKTATDQEIRDHIMADEMIELLDASIEYLNYMILNSRSPVLKLPNTDVGNDVLEKFKRLTSLETRHLLFKYFVKVIDLRETGKQMESTIAESDQQLEFAKSKIHSLTRTIQQMRHQSHNVHAMAKYSPSSPPEGAYGGRSPPLSNLALPEGSKSGRRGPSIPQQNLSKLQVTKSAPPAKVTFTNKKLIIEQSSVTKH